MVVRFCGLEYECKKAVKEGNKVTLYMENGGTAEFFGITENAMSVFQFEGGNWYEKPLEDVKTEKIKKSKTDLAAYLEAHPLQWTDGNYYSITEEKQNQLTRVFAVYEIDTALGKQAKLEWNDTGERCREWDKAELSMLASAINERVRPLVKYQQDVEVAIRNASALEELDGIVVDYDTV